MGNDRAAVTTLVSHARKCWSRFRRSRYLAEVKDRETLISLRVRGTAAMQEASFAAPGQQSITPRMVQKFARTARERIGIDGGGYRRDHLRVLASTAPPHKR